MSTRIPASDFHQLTDNAYDRVTELVVTVADELITVKAGTSVLHLTREQAQQLGECFTDWLSNRPIGTWSDFWTMALK